MNWRDHLRTRLLEIRPESLCALDAAALQLAGEVLHGTPARLHGKPFEQTCALALGLALSTAPLTFVTIATAKRQGMLAKHRRLLG